MNYVFGRMPRRVNFLSGGFHAIRAPYAQGATAIKRIGEDTALGQQLAQSGLIIELLKDLEAVHLKTYTARTFFRNNFLIPFHWTRVFLTFHGWKQFTSKGRFAHASAAQLLSIPLAHGTMLAFIASYAGAAPFSLVWALTAIWFILNLRFFLFFMHRQSLLFSAFAIPVTFIDHLVMGAGIICGFCIHTRRQDLTHTT
jgi:GT2 family glycosyltransferase